ncbi:hypothetical protein [Kutzneria sp. 744]|uniref:hypothetical protein n=1 Tax=Kutzneria sp. (strain 744) TaxID=345341 RepID=UPI0012F970CA|nr:hypothetical protein [Kutzneria sp. 744]
MRPRREHHEAGGLVNDEGTLAGHLFFGLVDGAFHALLERYELDTPDDAGTRDWVSVTDPAPDQAPLAITGSDTSAVAHASNKENHRGR